MKHVIAIVFLALGFCGLTAQSTATTQNGFRGAYYFFSQMDTISASAAADTIVITPSMVFYKDMDCVMSVQADSLSGGTTATATIQGTAYPGSTNWQTIGTAVTINGVSSGSRQTVQLLDSKIRLNVIAASSTQSTEVTFELGCKLR